MNWSHHVYHGNKCSDLFVYICYIIKNAKTSILHEAKYMHMCLSRTYVLSFNNKKDLGDSIGSSRSFGL